MSMTSGCAAITRATCAAIGAEITFALVGRLGFLRRAADVAEIGDRYDDPAGTVRRSCAGTSNSSSRLDSRRR
jgi:hypothetical protein